MKKLSMARKNVYKRIKRSNEKFAAMSKAEKRVQIAKDVLMQIEAKRIKPLSGTYVAATIPNNFKFDTEYGDLDYGKHGKDQVQDTLKDATCDACALGSMFLCAVDRHDKLRIKDLSTLSVEAYEDDKKATVNLGGSDMYDYLSKFFSRDQLSLIEDAFEGDYKDIGNDKKRLKAIMNNIIENDGEFVNDDLADEEYEEEGASEEAPF